MRSLTPDDVDAMLAREWPEAQAHCVELGSTSAVACLTPPAGSLRPGGYIAGPQIFAAADTALWFLVFGALGRVEPMALTSELSIRFLRPALGERLYARATLDKLGKRSVVGTVRIWTEGHEDRPCATAQGTYMLPS